MKKQSQIFLTCIVMLTSAVTAFAQDGQDAAILKCRESVWQAWFANDTKTLQELVPAEAIAISPSEDQWESQADIFRGAAEFQAQGGKLLRLEFPRSKIQRYGETAFVYSEFVLETEVGGKRSLATGRATEVFVLRSGHCINPGWHTDSHKQQSQR
jgi:ketosteroid isomerase-like protein